MNVVCVALLMIIFCTTINKTCKLYAITVENFEIEKP